MHTHHSPVTQWGLSHTHNPSNAIVLDIGCGGGAAIAALATLAPDGHVSGVDYSNASVAASRRFNAGSVCAGRVDVQQASVSRLPFANDTFDVAAAVETHYYWTDNPVRLSYPVAPW